MDIQVEKLWLIDHIVQVRDERLLNALKSMLEFGLQMNRGAAASDFWNELSEVQKQRIELAIRQLDAGEGIPHETVMAEFRKRYEASLKPMTYKELEDRALASEEDIKAGRLTDIEDLIKEMEN